MRDALAVWTVYGQPKDFPRHVVVRRFFVTGNGQFPAMIAGVYSTVEEARADIQGATPGAVRLQRYLDDDPAILETWL